MRAKLLPALLMFLVACSEGPVEPGEPALPTLVFPNGKLIQDTIGARLDSAIAVSVQDSLGQPMHNATVTFEVHAVGTDARLVNSEGHEVSELTATTPDGSFMYGLNLAADTGTAFVIVRLADQAVADSVAVEITPGRPVRFDIGFNPTPDFNLAGWIDLQAGREKQVTVIGRDRRNNPTEPPAVEFTSSDISTVSVTASGEITPNDFGSALVRASGSSGSDSVHINVLPEAEVIAAVGGWKSVQHFRGSLDRITTTPVSRQVAGGLWLNSQELVLSDFTVIDTVGNIIRSLLPDGMNAGTPLVADTAVYFVHRLINGNEELWRVSPQGGPTAKVLDLPGGVGEAAVSRDGTVLLYTSNSELIRVDLQTGIAANLGVDAYNVALSPDGTTIAYSRLGPGSDGSVQLATATGTPIASFPVAFPLGISRMQWSPDGRFFVFDFDGGGPGGLTHIRDMQTGEVVRMYSFVWNIAWRPAP